MKYCTHCGSEIEDEAVICVHCGCAVDEKKAPTSSNSGTLGKVALVFMIIGCVGSSLIGLIEGLITLTGSGSEYLIAGIFLLIAALIPLLWQIPMTVSFKNKLKNGEPVSTAFKVCTLLFVNIIAGILMLCMPSDNN